MIGLVEEFVLLFPLFTQIYVNYLLVLHEAAFHQRWFNIYINVVL